MTTCHAEGQYGTKIGMNRFNKHIAMSGPASLFYIHNHSNSQEDTDMRKQSSDIDI